MTFKGPVDFERVLATVERRLLTFDRFRQRVIPPWDAVWKLYVEIDPHFDIRAHVHRIALPAPGDKAALQNLMSDITSTCSTAPGDRCGSSASSKVRGWLGNWLAASPRHRRRHRRVVLLFHDGYVGKRAAAGTDSTPQANVAASFTGNCPGNVPGPRNGQHGRIRFFIKTWRRFAIRAVLSTWQK